MASSVGIKRGKAKLIKVAKTCQNVHKTFGILLIENLLQRIFKNSFILVTRTLPEQC